MRYSFKGRNGKFNLCHSSIRLEDNIGTNKRPNRVRGGFSPPTPHHPACGSAPGGSTKLPGRSRVMDLHPHFFDRYESLILQPLGGHTVLRRQPAGHGPRTVPI
jgi:hypothetical protein